MQKKSTFYVTLFLTRLNTYRDASVHLIGTHQFYPRVVLSRLMTKYDLGSACIVHAYPSPKGDTGIQTNYELTIDLADYLKEEEYR